MEVEREGVQGATIERADEREGERCVERERERERKREFFFRSFWEMFLQFLKQTIEKIRFHFRSFLPFSFSPFRLPSPSLHNPVRRRLPAHLEETRPPSASSLALTS